MYFEIKAFETPGEGSQGVKTKVQLNLGMPFSFDTQKEIVKEKLEPKRVYDILVFIANDLIPRILVKNNQGSFTAELNDLETLRDNRSWEDFFAYASPADLAKFESIENAMLQKAIQLMPNLEVPDITQFNFDQLSLGKLAHSKVEMVNSNVPPPRYP